MIGLREMLDDPLGCLMLGALGMLALGGPCYDKSTRVHMDRIERQRAEAAARRRAQARANRKRLILDKPAPEAYRPGPVTDDAT